MNPPVPRVWLGLAVLAAIVATFVLTRTFEGWTGLVPVSTHVPEGTRRVLLTLELTVVAVALQVLWWAARRRRPQR